MVVRTFLLLNWKGFGLCGSGWIKECLATSYWFSQGAAVTSDLAAAVGLDFFIAVKDQWCSILIIN